ncbi:hypothetical protein [Actinomadura sp. 3N407]|uniref:hypothetical protein n=1 Tax=Actinomadura sp. 3N407 TaxID=3457423 RepID=UPI003FCCF4DD
MTAALTMAIAASISGSATATAEPPVAAARTAPPAAAPPRPAPLLRGELPTGVVFPPEP